MSRIQRTETVRQGRIPVASNRAPLQVKGIDTKNFYYRFVLDVDDRIDTFLEAGYELVKRGKDGKGVASEEAQKLDESSSGLDSVYSKPAGRGLRLYLMRLPMELWEADQKAKRAENQKVMDSIKQAPKADYGKLSVEVKTSSLE